jgi:hypothetical protein
MIAGKGLIVLQPSPRNAALSPQLSSGMTVMLEELSKQKLAAPSLTLSLSMDDNPRQP